jgi:hypothetical protein
MIFGGRSTGAARNSQEAIPAQGRTNHSDFTRELARGMTAILFLDAVVPGRGSPGGLPPGGRVVTLLIVEHRHAQGKKQRKPRHGPPPSTTGNRGESDGVAGLNDPQQWHTR